MPEVSMFRLYVLRAMYLIITAGLALTVWPLLFDHSPTWPLMNSVVCAMLAAVSLLALLGIRYPLQMLPVLLFELVWKTIWLLVIALPLWRAGLMDARTMETVRDCMVGIILVPIALPWGYVFARYARRAGDPWRKPEAAAA